MPTSAEAFYDNLNSITELKQLIGLPEDADFDCKEWHLQPNAMKGSLAKAACGFTNATGGVIIIGMRASGRGPESPDVVQGLAPVSDSGAAASQALDIIQKSVEPGIEGLKVKTIPECEAGTSGFVVIYVPESGAAARRSKVDWRFYVRVASGTLPMEFFQVQERFGRRPPPRLTIHIRPQEMLLHSGVTTSPLRHLLFGLKNEGRSIAKFPGIRFKRMQNVSREEFGLDGNGGFGLPPRPSEPAWIVFRGGVDDVIYPGETRLIGKLSQLAVNRAEQVIARPGQPYLGYHMAERTWACEAVSLEYEIFAEDMASQVGMKVLEEETLTQSFQVRP